MRKKIMNNNTAPKKTIKERLNIIRENMKKRTPDGVPVMEIGPRRKAVRLLWVLLIISMIITIYRGFTVTDTHTVHEKEVIKEEVSDTNALENFVQAFAKEYYSWEQDKNSLEERKTAVNEYLTKELQTVNADMIRSDIPTSSEVMDVLVWDVEQVNDNEYEVIFSVDQLLTEDEKERTCTYYYRIMVYCDEKNSMVIIRNPTICPAVEVSSYQPKTRESDGTVDSQEQKEICDFLNTFFRLYPTASEKELSYYVKNNAILPINNENYVFAEILNPTFTKEDGRVNVFVTVRYLDQDTKAEQLSQFDLVLEKGENWKIVSTK